MNHPSPSIAAVRLRTRGGCSARRGGVYVLVLGASTMLAVVGLGAIAVTRTEIRSSRSASDWARAGVAAEAAIEAGVSRMNQTSAWRSSLTNGARVNIGPLAGASAEFALVDPADGNLADSDREAVTVMGYGQAGQASRRFSLECQYRPAPSLEVLSYGVYAAGSLSADISAVTGGPLGTPALTVTGVLTADVRVGTVSSTGTIIGEVRTGQSAPSPLRTARLSEVTTAATTISYAGIPGGTISAALLTAASNPYGATSASGVYRVRVPAGSILKITNSRLRANLVVELELGSRLEVSGAVSWDLHDPDYPVLVVQSLAASQLRIAGAAGTLNEADVKTNFNPTGSPYNGVDDRDKTDSYPIQIRGVIHAVGGLSSVELTSSASVVGVVISEGTLTLSGGVRVSHDPGLLTDPPVPYINGDAGMDPVPGSWRWVIAP